jgi:hypothetical protein
MAFIFQNRVTKDTFQKTLTIIKKSQPVNDIKLFNVYHQNIRGLRGKINELFKSSIPGLPSYIMLYGAPYESFGTTTDLHRLL